MNKKQLILDTFIKNPKTNWDVFGYENSIHPSHISRVISDYKRDISVIKEIGCVKSLGYENIYYLVCDDQEKVLEVHDNKIVNDVVLTEFEKLWLEINFKIT